MENEEGVGWCARGKVKRRRDTGDEIPAVLRTNDYNSSVHSSRCSGIQLLLFPLVIEDMYKFSYSGILACN